INSFASERKNGTWGEFARSIQIRIITNQTKSPMKPLGKLRVDCPRLATELSHGLHDAHDSFVCQLRIDRKREHFFASQFRLREISFFISKMSIGRLEMNRNWVM